MKFLIGFYEFIRKKRNVFLLLFLALFCYFVVILIEPLKLVILDNQEFDFSVLLNGLYFALGEAIIYGIYIIIRVMYLDDIDNAIELYYTKQWIVNIMAQIIRIVGETGAGKDTLASGLTSVLRESFIKDIKKNKLKSLRKILYQFRISDIRKHFKAEYQQYVITDKDIQKKKIIKYLKSNKVIKPRYRKYWNIDEMIESYQSGTAPKKEYYYFKYANKHILDLLIEYIRLVIRLQIKNYVFANQPFMEYKNVPAKVFSTDFLKLNHPNITHKKKLFAEKIKFPFLEYCIMYETESDAFWNNIQKEITTYIKTHGIRNFKAFIRHILGEKVYYIQVGQNAGRVNKLLRELDHAVIRVVGKEELPGHAKTIMLLKIIQAILYIPYYLIYLVVPLQVRYKNMLVKLSNQMDKLRDYGVIKLDVIISNIDGTGIQSKASIKNAKDSKGRNGRTATTLTFKTSRIRGRYNSWYLEFIADHQKVASDINILGVPSWGNDLKLTKDQVVFMNNPVLNKAFNIDMDDIVKVHYKSISKGVEE